MSPDHHDEIEKAAKIADRLNELSSLSLSGRSPEGPNIRPIIVGNSR